VKAIFILVSMLFTQFLRLIFSFFESVKSQDTLIKEKTEAEKRQREEGVPHPKDRFK
jgi:hypothetical protein